MDQSTENLIKQAELLFGEAKYKEIIDLLPDELLEQLNNAALFTLKARAFDIDNPELHFKYAQRSIDIDPHFSTGYFTRGNYWSSKKEYDKAISDYDKAIQLGENTPIVYNNRGVCWNNKKNYSKAIADYNKAIQLDKKFALAYYNRGVFWDRKKEYDKSISDFTKAIQSDKNYPFSYYNRAISYKNKGEYKNSIQDFERYINLKKDPLDYFTKIAKSEIDNLRKNISETWRPEIENLVTEIKTLLLFNQNCITHYTSLSAAKAMILEESPLRLSEGAFLNDTSEGKELVKYLNFSVIKNKEDEPEEDFIEKPFIGSFVNEHKHNDLTLWRMYGKEALTEARGCALTINREQFISNFESKILPEDKTNITAQSKGRYTFYKVAYIQNEECIIPNSNEEDKKSKKQNINDTEKLNKLLVALRQKIKGLDENQKTDIAKLINEIAYLFKSAEYQYEHEVRLVVEGIGIEKKFDNGTPPRVYIEMVDVVPVLAKITLGPKVERADEWAAAFNYHIKEIGKKKDIKIVISHLPFK
jgi:tetratricopeptide (TPR) repeat protein